MPAPKFTFVGSGKKRDGADLLGGALSASLSTLTKPPKIETPKFTQPTPTQINRQDAAMIQSGTTRPSIDQQHRDHFAQTHPEYTGGLEGARTREAKTAVVQAQSQVDAAQTKVDDAKQKWNEVKLEQPFAPASTYLTGGVPTTPSLPHAAGLQAEQAKGLERGWTWARQVVDLERDLKQAKGTLKDAEETLGHAKTQKAGLDRERELLADVSTPRWDQLIRDKYADADINGVVSETEVRSQKIKAKKGMVQAERNKAQAEMDAAQTIMFEEQNAAGDFWDPTRPTKRYAEAWREYQAAKDRVDELDVELNELANLDYPSRNESAFGRLAADPEAVASYASAQDVAADRDKVTAVAEYYQTGEGDLETVRRGLEYLSKKYGVTAGDFAAYAAAQDGYEKGPVMELYKKLDSRTEELGRDMEQAGYDLEDLYGYQQRIEKQQEAAKRAEEAAQFAREHPVLSSVATVVASPFQAVDLLNMDWGKGKPGDVGYIPPDSSDMTLVNAIQTVRGTISHDLARNTDWELLGQNVPAFLYNTGMSMAGSALAISTLGTGSVYLMGLNSAVNTAKEVVDNGGTTDQALKLGIAAGVAEVLFEKLSVEHLLKPKTAQGWRDVLTKVLLAQGGIELSEEALTETANILAEMSVLGQSSDYAKAVAGYRNQGASESEAKQKAFLDMAGRVGWAGAGGFISGIGMSGGKAAVDYAGQVYNAYTAQKTASTGETESTTIDTDPATHTPEQMAIIEKYKAAVDKGIAAFVERWRGLKDPNYRKKVRMNIATVNQRTIQDVKTVTGVDTSDFKGHSLSGSALAHIEKRHGAKGEADQSMADLNDIARMGYVLEHYDSVEALVDENGNPMLSGEYYNADGSRAPLVRFSKRVDGTYYVVEAVPDASIREFRVVSAYLKKGRDGTSRELDMSQNDPQPTSKTGLNARTVADTTIPQTTTPVKPLTKTSAQLAREAQVLSDLPFVDLLGSYGRTGLTYLLESRRGDGMTPRDLAEAYAEFYTVGFMGEPLHLDRLPAKAGPKARLLTTGERIQAYYNGVNDFQMVGQKGTAGDATQTTEDMESADGVDGIQESEFEDKARHVKKSILLGGRKIGFGGLAEDMRQAFREGLKTASPESQELLRQWKRKAKYRIAPGKRSHYRVSNGVITLGQNADASTVAHELFHWIDGGGRISSQLFEPLMQDYVALKMASEGSVKEYLIERFPEMFEMRGKEIVMRPEYRGISDILNGLSGGTESYGFGHDEEYWSKPGNLEAEVWAEFGMHQYENIEIALEMFQTLFPNLYKSAIIKLKELK